MVDVSINGDRAVFNVEGAHKLWAIKSRIEIPLTHVTGVEVNHDQVSRWWHGVKHDTAKTIIVSLDHERYKKLIVEVADPAAAARTINAACGR